MTVSYCHHDSNCILVYKSCVQCINHVCRVYHVRTVRTECKRVHSVSMEPTGQSARVEMGEY